MGERDERLVPVTPIFGPKARQAIYVQSSGGLIISNLAIGEGRFRQRKRWLVAFGKRITNAGPTLALACISAVGGS